MITIRGRLLTYGELWFDEEPPCDPAVDVLMYRSRSKPIVGTPCAPFLSLATDLSADEHTIMTSFGRTNRYKINRAESKDGLEAQYFADSRPHLDAFCRFYDRFAEQKSIERSYRKSLEAASDAGQLVLTSASLDAQPLVWHAYIRSDDTAVLLHSASHFRGKATADRAVVGRANRWLHWRDMLAFKRLGLRLYDWGGIFEDESVPERASINDFKREFGGAPAQNYNCTLAVTIKGKAYGAVRRLLHSDR